MENSETTELKVPETLKTEEEKPNEQLKEKEHPFIPNKGYETLSEALNDLHKRGFIYDFNIDGNCIFCADNKIKINPEEFEISEYYRFEGDSDPADNSVVYAISSDKHNLKGVLVNGYGANSDKIPEVILLKFKVA